MQEYEELMGELIELGITANPVCPFACCIIDPCGQILVTAANAMHISHSTVPKAWPYTCWRATITVNLIKNSP